MEARSELKPYIAQVSIMYLQTFIQSQGQQGEHMTPQQVLETAIMMLKSGKLQISHIKEMFRTVIQSVEQGASDGRPSQGPMQGNRPTPPQEGQDQRPPPPDSEKVNELWNTFLQKIKEKSSDMDAPAMAAGRDMPVGSNMQAGRNIQAGMNMPAGRDIQADKDIECFIKRKKDGKILVNVSCPLQAKCNVPSQGTYRNQSQYEIYFCSHPPQPKPGQPSVCMLKYRNSAAKTSCCPKEMSCMPIVQEDDVMYQVSVCHPKRGFGPGPGDESDMINETGGQWGMGADRRWGEMGGADRRWGEMGGQEGWGPEHRWGQNGGQLGWGPDQRWGQMGEQQEWGDQRWGQKDRQQGWRPDQRWGQMDRQQQWGDQRRGQMGGQQGWGDQRWGKMNEEQGWGADQRWGNMGGQEGMGTDRRWGQMGEQYNMNAGSQKGMGMESNQHPQVCKLEVNGKIVQWSACPPRVRCVLSGADRDNTSIQLFKCEAFPKKNIFKMLNISFAENPALLWEQWEYEFKHDPPQGCGCKTADGQGGNDWRSQNQTPKGTNMPNTYGARPRPRDGAPQNPPPPRGSGLPVPRFPGRVPFGSGGSRRRR